MILPETKPFIFLTNIVDMKAYEICEIYKQRWVIELFFKKLKQNFPLTYFYGDNRNAIQIQIWCILIACIMISYIQKLLKKTMELFQFSKYTSETSIFLC
jgi:IS4 transposase